MGGDEAGLQARLEELFLEELQDNVRILSEGVAVLERGQADGVDAGLVQQLFRAAHSLKGAAHSAGITPAFAPCHRLEELLAGLRAGNRAVDDTMIASLLEDVDVLVALEHELAGAATDVPADPPADGTASGSADDASGPAPAPQPTAPVVGGGEGRTRVPVARLDQLVQRAGALVSTTEQVGSLAAALAAAGDAAAAAQRRQSRGGEAAVHAVGERSPLPQTLARLSTRAGAVDRELRRLVAEVADTAQELRLQSFGDVAAGLDRSVRELCRSTGRQARLVVSGAAVELDRDVGDAIREPLLHLVRNAVDHGIEAPDQREAAGKPRTGTVRVSAAADGSRVSVTVSDDGAGIDAAALRASARHLPGVAAPDDDIELAFVPGLSTAATVTAVSGRGVGLDAVRARIESLGGTVHLDTEPGRGTEVELHVPRTLAVLRVVVVDAGGLPVAMPAANVARLHRLQDGDIEHLEGRLAVVIGDRRSTAVSLASALQLVAPPADGPAARMAVEIVGEDGLLLVGGATAELDVVLQPLPARLTGGPGALGAALLPSGEATVVVNPSAVLRVGLSMAAAPAPSPAPAPRRTVLLAEDTLTTRALERSILESAGYDVVVAADGAEAWKLLSERAVDVVVSDVDMPRMGGIELCRAMRASARFADLPVVLVTSLASDDDRRRGVEAGANAYIVKSAFEQAALLDAVRRLL